MSNLNEPIGKETEKFVYSFSTHWMKYVIPTFVYWNLLWVSLLLFYFSGLSAHHSEAVSTMTFLVALPLIIIVHHWYFHKLLSEAMVDVILTNKRIIYLRDSILLHDDMREVALDRLRAVEAQKHGLIQNIFRYGSLWFDTGGSASTDIGSTIPLVPHPHRVAKKITQLLEMK